MPIGRRIEEQIESICDKHMLFLLLLSKKKKGKKPERRNHAKVM